MTTIKRQRVTTYEERVPNTIGGFQRWEFTSGSSIGENFKVFARILKRWLNGNIPEGAKLEVFNRGHYYVSGFIERSGKYVYFSISDVRFFPNQWATNILIRTAKSNSDFTGGMNNYTTLDRFGTDVDFLLNR